MKVKCFGCQAMVEAGDVNAVADEFVAHGRTAHSWEYAERALRTYACNYAEAVERLSGRTQRLDKIGDVVVNPVTEERIDDWLQLFDHDGFADNPDWASCYCLTPHVPAPSDDPERPWRETRASMVERLQTGLAFGYLAYVDGKPAGWVNASLRANYGLYQDVGPDSPDSSSVIGVSCFVVAPPYRRHGIASALLDRVIMDAGGRGATWIEGYPHNDPERNDAGHFRGTRSMFDKRGFDAVAVRAHDTVMRRRVQ